MVKMVPHGGHCCGMKHVFDFQMINHINNLPTFKAKIADVIKEARHSVDVGIMRSEFYNKELIVYNNTRGEYDWVKDGKPVMYLWSDYQGTNGCLTVEIVLCDYQLEQRDSFYAKLLKELGFKLCARWKNPNSGNICNLFLLYDEVEGKLPYEW